MAVLSSCGRSIEAETKDTTPLSRPAPTSTVDAAELTAPPTESELLDELRGFISPTGNIACMVEPSWARCDIIDRAWSPPPRPADCEGDYGQGLTVSADGPAEFVCAGDTAFGSDEVLPYGDSIAVATMQCDSAESGITCRNTVTSHGFSISADAYRLF